MAGETEHRLVEHRLDGCGHIHVEWRQPVLLGPPRRLAEELGEALPDHAEARAIVEVALVQPETAVLLEIDHVLEDRRCKARLAIGREAHDLVLSRVHLEPEILGKGGIEQAEGMRKVDFLVDRKVRASAKPHARRRPLADAIHRQHHRLLEWRGEESARGVAQVMLGEAQPVARIEAGLDCAEFRDDEAASGTASP